MNSYILPLFKGIPSTFVINKLALFYRYPGRLDINQSSNACEIYCFLTFKQSIPKLYRLNDSSSGTLRILCFIEPIACELTKFTYLTTSTEKH